MDKKPQMLAKEAEVARLKELFANSQAVVLTDYRGLTVGQDVKLRAKLREAGVDYSVAKNTLIKLACHANDIDSFDPYLEGPTSIAFTQEPVELAKLMTTFLKDNKKGEVKCALLGDKFITAQEVEALAKLPSREVLLAQVVGMFAAPMANFAGVTSGILRQLVTVTDQVREQKAKAEA